MRVVRLTGSLLTPAVADIFINRKTGAVHHNLSHGAKSKGCWKWFAGISHEHFSLDTQPYELADDNYVLLPVKTKGMTLKDAKGNICYNIGIDSDPSHTSNILVLWSPADRSYTGIKTALRGACEVIGTGRNIVNRTRGESTPAPVVEIYGDAVLTWSGVRSDGALVEQSIEYSHGGKNWTFGDINVLEGDEHDTL